MTTQRMYQHEDLPLFSGQAPSNSKYDGRSFQPKPAYRQPRLGQETYTLTVRMSNDAEEDITRDLWAYKLDLVSTKEMEYGIMLYTYTLTVNHVAELRQVRNILGDRDDVQEYHIEEQP